ncbi:hypothetical protein K523DRAFT_202554, partial [Schizophyllum commune Tattone D]
LLNHIRQGELPAWGVKMLVGLSRPLPKGEIEPTYLYATNRPVQERNNGRLRSLPGEPVSYHARNCISTDVQDASLGEEGLEKLPALQTLTLKVGAQVMLIKNVDDTLVNGSVGTVISLRPIYGGRNTNTESDQGGYEYVGKVWEHAESYPIVRFPTAAGNRTVMIGREDFRVETSDGRVLAYRVQV